MGWRQPWTANDPLISDSLLDPTAKTALRKLTDDLAAQRAKLAEKARLWGYLDPPSAPAASGG